MKKIGNEDNCLTISIVKPKIGLKPEPFIEIVSHGQPMRVWSDGSRTITDIGVEVMVLLPLSEAENLINVLNTCIQSHMAQTLETIYKINKNV